MGIIAFLVGSLMGFILIVAYLCVAIGSLWVLRVAINWFWDFDFVAWMKGKR